MHGFNDGACGSVRNITPSHRNPNTRLCFVERPARRLKPKPRVALSRTETFRQVQNHGTDRAPQLRSKVTILPLNSFNEWPRKFNDAKCMFQNRGALWIVHAPHGAIFMTPVSRAMTSLNDRWQENCAAGYAQSTKRRLGLRCTR